MWEQEGGCCERQRERLYRTGKNPVEQLQQGSGWPLSSLEPPQSQWNSSVVQQKDLWNYVRTKASRRLFSFLNTT